MKLTKNINPSMFREYDLRAIAETDISDDVAYTIGMSYGSYIQENGNNEVVIGHDNRLSSPRIFKALTKGLTESGVDVIDLGLVTTPMFYFAKLFYNTYTGVMVTASHNPKEYNGFKISFSKIGNAYGKLIQDFKEYTYKLNFKKGNGKVIKKDIKEYYLQNIKNSIDLNNRKVKVVVDCGNGTGSIIIKDILDMFDIEYELLYCESNPNFPNHVPDPAVAANMVDLGKKVKELNYDFGIGIDGDADRVGVTDENGNFISADLIMLIVYRDIEKTMKNKKALFDVKCSRTLIDELKRLNIKPDMNRTGASYCNLVMQGDLNDPSSGYDFGGEYAGHLFFRDRYPGFDDGIYAGLRLIEIMSRFDKKFSNLLDNTNKYFSTEELKVKVTEESKFKIVDGVKEYVKEKSYEYNDIDGVRVEFADGWALIRCSNTGPDLTIRFEAKTKERLDEIQKEFENIINKKVELYKWKKMFLHLF